MMRELKAHERFVLEVLAAGVIAEPAAVRDHHHRRVRDFQHERLIHLIVTMFTTLFMLLSAGWLLANPSPGAAAVLLLLAVLAAAYLVHYFRLENGVQRLYRLSRALDERVAGRPLSLAGGPGADTGRAEPLDTGSPAS